MATDWHNSEIKGELPPYARLYPCIAAIARGKLFDWWIHKYYAGAEFKGAFPDKSGHLVVKIYYPDNPRSPHQQGNRSVFYDAVKNWQGFDDETKRYYNAIKGSGIMSGYNRYLRLYLKANYPMIIYWGTLEKAADDTKTIPAYIASDYFIRGLNIAPISWDGWFEAKETWIYASATTFTVPGDVTAKYPKGTKIKLTQTTVKYFYVIGTSYSAPNTTVTITGGSDYSLINAAITNNYYSYVDTPQGFPHWFNWLPDWTNVNIGNAAVNARFAISGRSCFWFLRVVWGSTTSASGIQKCTAPVPRGSSNPVFPKVGTGYAYDVSVTTPFFGLTQFDSSSTTLIRWVVDSGSSNSVSNTVPFVWTNGDEIGGEGTYEI